MKSKVIDDKTLIQNVVNQLPNLRDKIIRRTLSDIKSKKNTTVYVEYLYEIYQLGIFKKPADTSLNHLHIAFQFARTPSI